MGTKHFTAKKKSGNGKKAIYNKQYLKCICCSKQPCSSTSGPGLVSQISFSSVDYTVEGEDADVVQSPDQISVISAPTAKPEEPKTEEQPPPPQTESFVAEWPVAETSKVVTPKTDQPTLGYCFALYDYDAECSDELNLEEGQVRQLIKLNCIF